jgi:hypothetical protein
LRKQHPKDVGSQTDARRKRAEELAEELERCDREIAAAMKALLAGSAPIVDALLWYTDWCRERKLILLASDETESGRM